MSNGREIKTDLKGSTPADFMVQTALTDDSWGGHLHHVKSNQICSFSNVLEMALLIQAKLEKVGFPQSATEKRCWADENPATGREDRPDQRREKMRERKTVTPKGGPTFFIRINYRQNASWQGSIQWLEGKTTRFFRSHLEMVMLMQEAVEKSGGADSKVMFNSWEDAEESIS
jgi:hypothetical protein